ncbi:hypothetical protein [Agromyces indicus]|uniref:Uncharacterized protein n=1 Tax=Agromyces indicus TaxID=758919 RepID=A0ABU1FH47_9MICO|nr:hypothetical protein [Agromyces indicus]MDR5691069.1 hypothetical protein [Agromyces indicus]
MLHLKHASIDRRIDGRERRRGIGAREHLGKREGERITGSVETAARAVVHADAVLLAVERHTPVGRRAQPPRGVAHAHVKPGVAMHPQSVHARDGGGRGRSADPHGAHQVRVRVRSGEPSVADTIDLGGAHGRPHLVSGASQLDQPSQWQDAARRSQVGQGRGHGSSVPDPHGLIRRIGGDCGEPHSLMHEIPDAGPA